MTYRPPLVAAHVEVCNLGDSLILAMEVEQSEKPGRILLTRVLRRIWGSIRPYCVTLLWQIQISFSFKSWEVFFFLNCRSIIYTNMINTSVICFWFTAIQHLMNWLLIHSCWPSQRLNYSQMIDDKHKVRDGKEKVSDDTPLGKPSFNNVERWLLQGREFSWSLGYIKIWWPMYPNQKRKKGVVVNFCQSAHYNPTLRRMSSLLC